MWDTIETEGAIIPEGLTHNYTSDCSNDQSYCDLIMCDEP